MRLDQYEEGSMREKIIELDDTIIKCNKGNNQSLKEIEESISELTSQLDTFKSTLNTLLTNKKEIDLEYEERLQSIKSKYEDSTVINSFPKKKVLFL